MTIVSLESTSARELNRRKRNKPGPPSARATALRESREAQCLTLDEVARRWNLCTGTQTHSAEQIDRIERAPENSSRKDSSFVQVQACIDAGPAGTSDERIVDRWDEIKEATGEELKRKWRSEGKAIARAVWNSTGDGREFLDRALCEMIGNKDTSKVENTMGGSYIEVNEYRARVALVHLSDLLRVSFPDRRPDTDFDLMPGTDA